MELKNNKKHLTPFNGTHEQQEKSLYYAMELKNNKRTPYTIQWN
jgi:hypothetical protein